MKILIFFSNGIYPKGGFDDYIGKVQTLDEAREVIRKKLEENNDEMCLVCWWQLVQEFTYQIIEKSN